MSGDSVDCSPSSSKSCINELPDGEDDFYFETDHVALKGNKDYLNLLKTVAVLEAQRIRAVADIDKILDAKEEALKDPFQFVEKLQNGELDIPVLQVIAEVPQIDWSKYSVSFPAEPTRPITRNAVKPLDGSGKCDEETSKEKCKILVRGRMFDESKPETFNQSWTTEEQRRLEELLVLYPSEEVEANRWKKIAAALGNRTPKQVCSRVQKYFLKLQKAGMPIPGRAPKMQPSSIRKRSYHRHQRHNHFLFRHTTFFPCQDVPVYMSEFDEETTGSNPNYSSHNPETDIKEEVVSDDEQSGLNEKLSGESRYQQMQLLRRVLKEKQKEGTMPRVEHTGFKCDFCQEEPIVGTRWHCSDCGSDQSVDFCTDCVVSQLESSNPHPLSHHIVTIRGSDSDKVGVFDKDYLPQSFSASGGTINYNYLDPNFMPG
ncbi:ZZ-type zinc finger-containing protein 3 isoform X1 [Anabrus simplex]|uniref:ZZ-type zinc finger-containing protein 3 isoform X1 n=1 Tax=Anabrus simplex TaxID=316456 RepID=UPI0034DD94F5